jgi:hypothetical protein
MSISYKVVEDQPQVTTPTPSREDLYSSSLSPAAAAYQMVGDPLLESAAVGADLVTFGMNELNKFLGNSAGVLDYEYRKNNYGLPSDMVTRFRSEISQTLGIEEPETRAQIGAEKIGDFLKYAAYYGVLQPVLNRIPVLKTINKSIIKEIKEKPLLVAGTEAGAIAAGTEAEFRGAGPKTTAAVEIGTSFSLPAIYNQIQKRVFRTLTDKEIIKQYGLSNFQKASQMIQEILTKSPEEVSAQLAKETAEGTPISIITGDEGFTPIEAYLMKEFGESSAKERDKLYLNTLQSIFGNRQNVKTSADFLRDMQKRNDLSLDNLINKNAELSANQLDDLKPDSTAEELSQSLFDSLNKSFRQGKEYEDKLWANVDLDRYAYKIQGARKKFLELYENLGDPQKVDMPSEAIKFLQEPGKLKSVRDVYSLYSKLGEVAAIARNEKSFNTARLATQIRKALLDDLDKIDGVGTALDEARQYSRLMNEKFNRGIVGDILNVTEEGLPKVEPTLVSKKVKAGEEGRITIEQISKAIKKPGYDEFTPITQEEFGTLSTFMDVIRERFVRDASNANGEIDVRKAGRFIEKYSQILNQRQFQPLKLQLESATDATDALRSDVADYTDLYKTRFGTKGQGAFNKFINANSSNRMRSILEGGNPVGQMDELIDLVQGASPKDFKELGIQKSDVLQGFKDSVYDYVIQQGTKGTEVNFSTLKELFRNPEKKAALQKVLSKAELDNLDRYVQQIEKFNEYKIKVKGDFDEIGKLSVFDNLLALASGAALGKVLPGSSLIAIGYGKRTVLAALANLKKGEVRAILNDAFQDPKLFDALLMNQKTIEAGGLSKKINYLNKYLLSRGITYGAETPTRERTEEIMEKDLGLSDRSKAIIELLNPLSEPRLPKRDTIELLNPFSETRLSMTPGIGRFFRDGQ